MSVASHIEILLQDHLRPSLLRVRDDSHQHAGHAGSRPEGETHFHVTIVSEVFSGLSRVNRQRKVYEALKSLLQTRIHALQIEARAPGEAMENP